MNLDRVEELIRLVRESAAQELSIESDDYTLVVRKRTAVVPAAKTATPPASSETTAPESVPAAKEIQPVVISAPMVGIFRHPQTALEEGTPVEVGQVVGTIEVMKLPNEVRSDWDGIILRTLVEDGQPVEYGQPVLELVPAQAMGALREGEV